MDQLQTNNFKELKIPGARPSSSSVLSLNHIYPPPLANN